MDAYSKDTQRENGTSANLHVPKPKKKNSTPITVDRRGTNGNA